VDPPKGFPRAGEIKSLKIPYETMSTRGKEIREKFRTSYK